MEKSEYAPNSRVLAYSFLGRGSDGLSNADRIWFAQRKVILELAEKENCVIVGRCADYLLKDKADCLNVFIYATPEFRADRIVKLYGESPVEPLKRLADKDKKRKLNYKYFTEQEWGKTQNYHMCLDSGYLGIDTTVDLIVNTFRKKEENGSES